MFNKAVQDMLKLINPYMNMILIIFIVIGLIITICLIFLFKKANKPQWAPMIPIYQTIVLFQVVGVNPLWLLTIFIPFINIIFIFILYIIVNFHLARSFNKSFSFGLGLCLFPYIFYPLLSVSKSDYLGPNGISIKLAPQPIDDIPEEEIVKIIPQEKSIIEPEISMGNSKNLNNKTNNNLSSMQQPVSLKYKVCPYCGSKLGLETTTCFLCGKRVVDN